MIRLRFINRISCRGAAGFASSSAPPPPSQQPVQYKAPRQMTVEQVTKIGETDAAMRAAYDAVPESFIRAAREARVHGVPALGRRR